MSLQNSLGRTAKTSGGLERTGEHRQQQHCRTSCREPQEGLVDTGKDWWTQATTVQNQMEDWWTQAATHCRTSCMGSEGGLVDTGNNTEGYQGTRWRTAGHTGKDRWTQATTLQGQRED